MTFPEDPAVDPLVRLARITSTEVATMTGSEEYSDLEVAAQTVWGLLHGITRGRGIPLGGPAPADLAAVARAATARLYASPFQWSTASDTDADGTSSRREGGFAGFTLAEQLVVNRYRVRLA